MSTLGGGHGNDDEDDGLPKKFASREEFLMSIAAQPRYDKEKQEINTAQK